MVRGSLFGAMAGKLVADTFGAVADTLHAAARGIDRIGDVAFYFEADQARRYKGLTGIDLGQVIGHNDRFEATEPGYEPEIVAFDVEEEEEGD